MAIISFNRSQYNDQAKKQAAALKKLQEQNAFRFQYPTEDNADLLKTLLDCTWKDISFPVIKIDTQISHDIVKHKYPNRDGARLENMGRNPLIVKVTAVFANTINPGKNETWEKGTLYPNVYEAMLNESLDSSNEYGYFQHPFIGAIACQIESFVPVMDAKFRGGEMVEITFVETVTGPRIPYGITILDSAAQAATNLDAAFANLNPDPNTLGLPKYKTSLTDALKKVKSSLDQTSRALNSAYSTAPIDELYGRCKEIVNSTEKLGESSYSFVKQTATILKSAMVILKNQGAAPANNVKSLITSQPNTLGSYSSETGNSVSELIYLNPNLLKKPLVPSNTTIRYYQK